MRAPPGPCRKFVTTRRAALGAVLAAFAALASACREEPPLTLTASAATVDADGLTRVTLTATARDPIAGAAVVVFTADGGALSASAVPLVDNEASVALIAPLERELGRKSERSVHVAAHVAISDTDGLDAAATLTARPPASGAPVLFLDADPPAARVDAGGAITVRVLARRVSAGTALAVSAVGAGVDDDTAVVGADGTASARIAVPAAPVDATVTLTEPASGVSSSIVVRFVAPGAPLFDLTGSFVQIGPARVKLVSGGLAPNPQCAVAPSLVRADFVQTGLELDAHYTTCDVTFPPVTSIVGTVTNRAGPSFYAAIPRVDQHLTLDSGDLGALYAPPPSVVVVGADLDDPAHDDLPSDENDPRVVDADADGAPGVTVQNSLGGDQHIVFRNVGTSKGAVASSNLIRGDRAGDLVAVTETSVFGIGGAFLPDTEALGSVVELVRVDGRFGAVDADADGDGVVSCDELVDVAQSLDDLDVPDTPFDCGSDR